MNTRLVELRGKFSCGYLLNLKYRRDLYGKKWEHVDRSSFVESVDRNRLRGKTAAVLIAKYRNGTLSMGELAGLYEKVRSVNKLELFCGRYLSRVDACDGFRAPQIFRQTAHMVTSCPDDPMYLTYVPDVKSLMAESGVRTIKIRPGKFLRKFFPDMSDDEVREAVHAYEFMNKPPEVRWVENTDPDGWEWVYENGSGFQSCMTYDRSGRYLDSNLTGEYHPARVYARRGNGLRLAYIGDDERVFARCIVREDMKTFVRVYGDDRLGVALTKLGYKQSDNFSRVELNAVEHPGYSDGYVMPYLDGTPDDVDFMGDYFVVTRGGDYGATSSSGYIRIKDKCFCPRCSAELDDEDDLMYSHNDEPFCSSCEEDFIHAVVGGSRRYPDYGVVHCDNTVEVCGITFLYDSDLISSHGYVTCDECGEWADLDDTTSTERGYVCGCTEIVELDIESPNGYNYAVVDDVLEVHIISNLMDGDDEVYKIDSCSADFESGGLSTCGRFVLCGSADAQRLLAEHEEKESENV